MTLFSVCERIHNSVTTMHERSWRVVNAVRLKLGVCQNIVLYVLEVANLYSSMYSTKSSTYKRRKGWIIWPKNRGKAHSRVWRSKDGPPFLKALTENAEHFEEELNKIPCKFTKKLEIMDCDRLFSSEPSQLLYSWIYGTIFVCWQVVDFRQ